MTFLMKMFQNNNGRGHSTISFPSFHSTPFIAPFLCVTPPLPCLPQHPFRLQSPMILTVSIPPTSPSHIPLTSPIPFSHHQSLLPHHSSHIVHLTHVPTSPIPLVLTHPSHITLASHFTHPSIHVTHPISNHPSTSLPHSPPTSPVLPLEFLYALPYTHT